MEIYRMKKSLFAVAALAAVAGSAQAQSSVTVYGILDVGYMGSNLRGTTAGTNAAASTTQLQQTNQIAASAEQTSRLGFKGSEDMGGGTSAFFTIETGLTPTGSTTSTWNNRQSFVGLKKNGVGQFAVGTQYTPVFNKASETDPGQFNNIIGNIIYATNNFSNNINGQGTIANPYGNASSPNGTTNDGFTSRTSNTLSVESAVFSGFKASAVYVMNNVNQTQTSATQGGNTNWTGWGLSADYTWNKLYAAGAYQAFKSTQPGTLTSPTVALASTSFGGTNSQDNQGYLGATYDFGILKAYAQWQTRKAYAVLNNNYFAKRQVQQIGVRSYITPTIEAWASGGNGRLTAYGLNQPTANIVAYQLGSNYYLSKRTNLYAIFGSAGTSNTSTSQGVNGNNYAIGVRHTF
jgi:predicted porin